MKNRLDKVIEILSGEADQDLVTYCLGELEEISKQLDGDKWLIHRDAVESNFGSLSDDQWSAVVDEIMGRVDNYIEEIIQGVVEESRGVSA